MTGRNDTVNSKFSLIYNYLEEMGSNNKTVTDKQEGKYSESTDAFLYNSEFRTYCTGAIFTSSWSVLSHIGVL